MHYITDTLYWISTGLLVPVVLLLIYFFVRSLLLIGGWFGQYMDVRKWRAATDAQVDALTVGTLDAFAATLPGSRLAVADALKRLLAEENPARIEKLLADFEVEAEAEMSFARTLAKMGPMLGLMGTLIPMGPALVGLSTGDIASMAYNMQVAFATTVIGLFSAAVGFVVLQSKQRWHARDLNTLEYVASLIEQKQSAQ